MTAVRDVDDPVLEVLSDLARMSFPAIYRPDRYAHSVSPIPPPAVPSSAAWGEPSRSVAPRFVDAITADPDFRIFGEAPTEHGQYVNTSTGISWRAQVGDMPPSIVTSAAENVLLKGRAIDAVDPLLEELAALLNDFRRMLRGGTGEAVALTGFEGFAVAEPVSTPWGELRSAGPFEQQWQPFGSTRVAVVLETRLPLRLWIAEPDDRPSDDVDRDSQILVGRAGGLVPLTLVLATADEASYVVGDAVWQTTIIPFSATSGFTGRLPRARFPQRAEWVPPSLSDDQVEQLQTWADRVNAHYDPVIDIAVRRTMSAIRERIEEEDAIIDAVVAWDNLFGHPESRSEVTFRVTTAIARLLEDDSERRDELRRSLAKVYDVRSKVVHGSPLTANDKLHERSPLATDVAVRCLRTLFRDRPELIADRNRGMRIILD